MSAHRHATISAWQRDHDGGYAAELHGWTLKVKWHPETPKTQRGFTWSASREGEKIGSKELHEEIELAMVAAEIATEPPPAEEEHHDDGHGHAASGHAHH